MSKKLRLFCFAYTSSLAIAVTLPTIASAQEEASSAAGEIVVTAQKREQRLQDVGLSVAAVGADQLAEQRIQTLADIANAVPSLVFSQSQLNTPVYTLRGVGFNEATFAGYPDVSVYVDQFPLPLPVLSSHSAYDLERVEVLKGPQGTLFGNNATGGAVNMIAAKPLDRFEAGGSLGYGRFNTVDVSGYVTGPLSSTLNGRIAVQIERSDDWQKSYTSDATNGEKNSIAGRLLLDWKPSDSLAVSLNLNGWKDKGEPQAGQFTKLIPQNPAGTVGFFGTVPANLPILNYPLAPNNPRAADFSTGERDLTEVVANPSLEPVKKFSPYSDNEFWQAALRADLDLTENITLTSLTSYIRSNIEIFVDTDGTALYGQDFGQFGKIRSFNQEVRLSGRGRLQWVIGANYERTKVHEFQTNYSADTSSGVTNASGLTVQGSDQKMRNYAIFGNVEFEITPQLTAKGGIRRTWADRTFTGSNIQGVFQDPDPRGVGFSDFFNTVWTALSGFYPNFQPVPLGECFMIDNRRDSSGAPLDPSTFGTAGCYNDKLKERNTSWSVGLDYKPIDDLLLYANVAKGYKAGSFPLAGAATWDQLGAVTQESLINYEAGFKSTLADGAVTLNGAAFYYDYRDKQLRSQIVDQIFGLLQALVNVPKSTIKGAELEFAARPVEGLSLGMSATYLDARIKRFEGIVGAGVDGNGLRFPITASYKGASLPFAPKWQFAANFRYETPLSDRASLFFGGNVSAQSKSYAVPVITAVDKEDFKLAGRALFGGNIGVKSPDDRWSAMFWGKNIFNKYYRTTTLVNYDQLVSYAGRPAEYGLTVSFKFN